MARDCGIEMMESRLYEERARHHFLTKRFDRRGDEKLHMQTMCALAHLDYNQPRTASYETLFRIANFLQLSMKEKEQIFRRMVFNVVARNHDDHTKNFSFLMDQSGKWSLAPAYDLTYSCDPDNYWLKEHNLLINGKSKDFTRADFKQLAKTFHIVKADDHIDEIIETCSGFKTYAKKAKVKSALAKTIMESLLLCL
jgi:serine/threonine-protein kinase HipA